MQSITNQESYKSNRTSYFPKAARTMPYRTPVSIEEFNARCFRTPSKEKMEKSRAAFKANTTSTIKAIGPMEHLLPRYQTVEELYRELAKRYDLEDLRTGDLTHILGNLRAAGILTSQEWMSSMSPVPVMQGAGSYPYQSDGYNAIENYAQEYRDYIDKYCQNVPPSISQTLQEALAVHNKVEGILREIQSYRVQ